MALRASALGLALVLSASAMAQYSAPEGNAHPPERMVSEGGHANPFGPTPPPLAGSQTTTEAKRALASAVDLEPLRDLAVFHNGRVKILDTLARETVREITGRRDYFDVGEGGLKLPYDPLFTMLDLMMDPSYYGQRPLIAVGYLPLRREFVERAFPQDDRQQDVWMRLQRISPAMYAAHAGAISDAHMGEPAYREALGRVDEALRLWDGSPANMLMVAPPTRDQPWTHLSTLASDHPARAAALDLGNAWRAGDAAGVSRAAATLAAELPRINAEVYPTTRRELETLYNKVNAFEWGAYAYFLSLLALMLAFGTGRRWLVRLGVGMLAVSVLLHTFGFVARCIIAERFAIQNQFESMTGLSLFGAVLGLGMAVARRQWIFGAAAAGLGFLVLLAATQTGIPGVSIEREAAILNTSVLLKYHVTTVLVSYGLITLGFIVSLFFLASHYFGRRTAAQPGADDQGVDEIVQASLADDPASAAPSRTLHDLDRAQMTILQLAFWTLGVGILLGAWWADHSWGRWWAFDPKETWALITWIVYLVVIHVRQTTGSRRGLVTAWLSVAGFFIMLWTYFGVNLLLPGLHAYA